MAAKMSMQARRELLNSIRQRYRQADKKGKSKVLDEFTGATGYGCKHAVALLRKNENATRQPNGKGR